MIRYYFTSSSKSNTLLPKSVRIGRSIRTTLISPVLSDATMQMLNLAFLSKKDNYSRHPINIVDSTMNLQKYCTTLTFYLVRGQF